jgi:hypothetical protein
MLRSQRYMTFLVMKSLSGVYLSAKARSIDIFEHHIDLKLDTNLVEIISDMVMCKSYSYWQRRNNWMSNVGLTAGVSPISIFKRIGN